MPKRPKKSCNQVGCPELIEAGKRYCEKHKKQRHANYNKYGRDKQTAKLYDDRWRKASKRFLTVNPLCVKCKEEGKEEGKVRRATVTDHVVPHKGDPLLFWDESNWQALCKSCHDRKTVKSDGGFGNQLAKW